ncbi:MAG: integrase [Candidatus Bathyarchaeia archaeon]
MAPSRGFAGCGTVLGRSQSLVWDGPVIDYRVLRDGFVAFLESRRFNGRYVKCMLSYLDKYVSVIRGPMDVVRVFAGLTEGQQHNLSRGLRNLFNFLEAQGFDKEYLDVLRRNIPKDNCGFDVHIPSEDEIIASLRVIAKGCFKYRVVYELILDSGLRLEETCRFINAFSQAQVEEFEGFCVAPLGYFRRSKLAYFAFFTDETFRLLKQLKEKVDPISAVTYRRKKPGLVAFKYLRKFVNDTMTSDELNIPESVADFIQGRTPKSIGAKHYMKLKRKAIQFYPRYAQYIAELRRKAGLREN